MTKWAIVTGASSGIGAAIAEELAMKGYHILLVGRNTQRLNENAALLSSKYKVQTEIVVADLSTFEGIATLENAIQEHAANLEILVNNAGVGIWGKFQTLSWKDQYDMLTINNTALLKLTHAVLPIFAKQKKGYLLNVASTAGFQAVPGMAVYSASKIFVLQFSRGLAVEQKDTGVQVTCVCPGATETSFVEAAGMKGSHLEQQAEKFNMSPKAVAAAAVKGMFAGKTVVTPGIINQLNYVAAKILPRKVLENGAAQLYLKNL